MEQSFFINPTTFDEIESQFKYIKNYKASGPNSIPTTIFKNFQINLCVLLTELINLSFNQEKFPAVLKIAIVTPTFKKSYRLNVNSYRPTSLISNIIQIIEKLIHKRLNSFYLSLVSNIQQHTHLLKQQTKLKKPVIVVCMPVVFILI